MNLGRVGHILGLLLLVLAAAQLLPLLWCIAPESRGAAPGFAAGAVATALLGVLLRRLGHAAGEMYRREGVLIVVGAWVLASLSGAIPYVVTGAIAHPVDALFESASGFTTTGASILTDIEALPRALLFWRSFTQWLGGIGIVVLFVALLSELGPGARFLFKLEVPGPQAEVLHARVQHTAAAMARIYLVLTALQIALLLLLGLDFFDAATHTFSTVSTGGFSPYADSVGHFDTPVQLLVVVFMLAAAVNFSLYYGLVRRRDTGVLRDAELRAYLVVVGASTAVIVIDLLQAGAGPAAGVVVDALFAVVSSVTTTGFATQDFAAWPGLAQSVLVALMLAGGCAGSTAGGAKIVRVLVGWRAAMREVRLTFNPSAVIPVVVGGQVVPEASVRSVVALLVLWVLAWGAGALALSVGDPDIATAGTASIATLSNVGPGLGEVGPFGGYAQFAGWQKLAMVLLMWLGRLEFFALLALFQPRFWRA